MIARFPAPPATQFAGIITPVIRARGMRIFFIDSSENFRMVIVLHVVITGTGACQAFSRVPASIPGDLRWYVYERSCLKYR
ncbi:MAG: hypothetical protein ACTSUE_21930 [Promethearchaeota archaeon]